MLPRIVRNNIGIVKISQLCQVADTPFHTQGTICCGLFNILILYPRRQNDDSSQSNYLLYKHDTMPHQ